MIPQFTDGMNLPVGGHFCTVSELEERFARNEHRKRLFQILLAVLKLARRCGFVHALLGGSFPTAKEQPGDIDVTWFCHPGTTKTTVQPECIELMMDGAERGNFQFVPYDEGTSPADYQYKLDIWGSPSHFGFDDDAGAPRGVIFLDLQNDDPKLS